MSQKKADNKADNIEDLLNNPVAVKATSNENKEIVERRGYQPPICDVFSSGLTILSDTDQYGFTVDREAKKKLPKIINHKVQLISKAAKLKAGQQKQYYKKRNIGIVFSGGPAPGGHNVIGGLFDAAKKANPKTKIYGFLLGPDGIIENETVEITAKMVDAYRNLGGFSMIKTGRTKIDSRRKMAFSKKTCQNLNLDALIIVGGDDSNTNAAFLAEEFYDDKIQVIGIPKTIDGDIQVKDLEGNILCAISFGFHTAARAFSNEISNLCTDSGSDVKYWHICKVMGRVASHLALEVALQTHANMTLIGEDLAEYIDQDRIIMAKKQGIIDYTAYGMTLRHLSRVICNAIIRRAGVGKNYGVIVIPEGILEFINEIQVFIIKLNTIIAYYNQTQDLDFHEAFPILEDKLEYLRRLAKTSRETNIMTVWNSRDDDLFNDIPGFFQEGLLTERDSHGNFQFSLVETDKVLMGLVRDYLNIKKEKGLYKTGIKKDYFQKVLKQGDLDPEKVGPVLFKNYINGEFLLVRENIFSFKTLKTALQKADLITKAQEIPAPIEKIYTKSVPKFKTQAHFYGYDGRGNDPTCFDCNYTYNLGLTAFSLIANGATGQMAAIKNLEKDFSLWQPIGIPIAPLMHLEERNGKLALVLEKSVVDVNSVSFQIVKALREKWLAAVPGEDNFRQPGPIRFAGKTEEDRPITLVLNALAN